MNPLPNNMQKITRKHGKCYLLLTKVEHSPFAVGNTRRNAPLQNVSQLIFLRKEVALLQSVLGEFACYTSIIYVFDTKRHTIRVRKAVNNKFVCVFITCKVFRNWMLIKFILLPALSHTKKIDCVPKVSESRFGMQEDLPKALVKLTLSIRMIAL